MKIKHHHIRHARKRIYHACKVWIEKSVPRVTVSLHSAEPHDALVTLRTDLGIYP